MPRVSMKSFWNYEIDLPSLEEQKRIAAILDKADSLRRKRQQALQLADDFLRATFLDLFGDPVTNPKGWPEATLNELCHRIQIGPFGTQLHQEDYVSGGIPLINPTHIVNGNIVPDINLTVSEEKYLQLSEYHMSIGDIVLGRRGEMGRCARISDIENGYLCGTGSLFLRPDKTKINSIFLEKTLSSKSAKSRFERASQGATMPNLNKAIVGGFKIGIPPMALQEKFQQIAECSISNQTILINGGDDLMLLAQSLAASYLAV